MKKSLCLPLLLTALLLCGGCQKHEPEPDFSGLAQLTYSLQASVTGNATSEIHVAVYPTFFQDYVTVEAFPASGEVATIYFSDEKGKYTKKIALPEGNRSQVQVNFSGMPKAVYICEVQRGDKVDRYRLVKVR
ncbi:hypothetical protein ACFS7Z_12115 [Pontibacter toksunensis]|uniref:Por secretion system C-terminal sorting domain-containing protein n=1 Tax=Pontibacter toksunensis TaxID=1332631 RepID=A0ABW6BXJ6_9BACT